MSMIVYREYSKPQFLRINRNAFTPVQTASHENGWCERAHTDNAFTL